MASISTISRSGRSFTDNPFEVINRKLTITLSEDSRDPLDHTSYVIPKGTVLSAVLGTGNDAGIMKPVRRALVTNVESSVATVVDAEPFADGDILQYIDATGPETGGVADLGTVSNIDYTNNTFTVSNVGSLAKGDWIEVKENGTGNDTSNIYNYSVRGVLAEDVEIRVDATNNSTAAATIASMVVDGVIHESNLNIPDSIADDPIVRFELSTFNLVGDVIVLTNDFADASYAQEDLD